MRKIKCFVVLFLMLFCVNVKADDNKCDSKELSRLKEW